MRKQMVMYLVAILTTVAAGSINYNTAHPKEVENNKNDNGRLGHRALWVLDSVAKPFLQSYFFPCSSSGKARDGSCDDLPPFMLTLPGNCSLETFGKMAAEASSEISSLTKRLIEVFYPHATYISSALNLGLAIKMFSSLSAVGAESTSDPVSVRDESGLRQKGRSGLALSGSYLQQDCINASCAPLTQALTNRTTATPLPTTQTNRTTATTLPTTSAPVSVRDESGLRQIGRSELALSGSYLQQNRINASSVPPIGTIGEPFTGQYNGNANTIANLQNCLFKKLSGNAVVRNLTFVNADISSNQSHIGVVACEMAEDAVIENIRFENSTVNVTGNEVDGALGTGRASNRARLLNLEALNCRVDARSNHSDIAIAAGSAFGHTEVSGITARNCNLTSTGRDSDIAIGVGYTRGSTDINNVRAEYCHLASEGSSSEIAVGVGQAGSVSSSTDALTVRHISADNSTLSTRGAHSELGIGAGVFFSTKGEMFNISARRCHLLSQQHRSNIGIGAGKLKGDLSNTEAISCIIEARSFPGTGNPELSIGIGAGILGRLVRGFPSFSISNTLAVDTCLIVDTGFDANVGIASGSTESGAGSLSDTRSVDCHFRVDDLSHGVRSSVFTFGFAVGMSDSSGLVIENTLSCDGSASSVSDKELAAAHDVSVSWHSNEQGLTTTKTCNTVIHGNITDDQNGGCSACANLKSELVCRFGEIPDVLNCDRTTAAPSPTTQTNRTASAFPDTSEGSMTTGQTVELSALPPVAPALSSASATAWGIGGGIAVAAAVIVPLGVIYGLGYHQGKRGKELAAYPCTLIRNGFSLLCDRVRHDPIFISRDDQSNESEVIGLGSMEST